MGLEEIRRSLGISRSVLSLLSGVALERLAQAEREHLPLSASELTAVREVFEMFLQKRLSGLERLRIRMTECLPLRA